MLRSRCCACVLCAVAAAVAAYLVLLATPSVASAQPAKPVSFINDVAPVLKENCFACHDAKKKSGKYDMTTYEKIMAGGVGGDPVTAGKPEASEFHSLLVTTEQRRMPPRDKGEAVPKEKAAVIAQWIKEGAKLDAGIDAKADLVKELRVRWKPPVPPKAYPFPIIVNALAFAPDGKSLVVGGHHELTVWEIATGKLLKRVRTRAERAYGLAFLPDGKLVVAGGRPGQEGDVRVYDINAKVKSPAKVDDDKAFTVAVEMDGEKPVVRIEKKVTPIDQLAGEMKKTIQSTGRSDMMLDIGKDVPWAVETRILDAAKGNGVRRIINATKKEDGVEVLDGVNDKAVLVKHLFDVEDSVLCLAVTPDGKTLAAGGCDRAVRIFDLSDGLDKAKLAQTVENHADWVLGCALSADGKYLVTAGRDKTAKVWDIKEKQSVVTFPEHQNIVYGVAVKADGSAGFSVGADKQLRTWKPNGEGKQVKNAGGHSDDVFKVIANPKQPLLATSSADKTVRLWNLDTLAAGKSLTGLTDYVYTVAFSADGELVAGGSYDGAVAVWGVKDGALVKAFNASPGLAPKEPEPKKK